MHAVLMFQSALRVTSLRKEKLASLTSWGYFNKRLHESVQSLRKSEWLSHFVGIETKAQSVNGLVCRCLSRTRPIPNMTKEKITAAHCSSNVKQFQKGNTTFCFQSASDTGARGAETGKDMTTLTAHRPALVCVMVYTQPVTQHHAAACSPLPLSSYPRQNGEENQKCKTHMWR